MIVTYYNLFIVYIYSVLLCRYAVVQAVYVTVGYAYVLSIVTQFLILTR